MKDIFLYGEVGKKFCKKISLEVNTCQDIFFALQSNFSEFGSYILQKRQKGVFFLITDKNNKNIGEIFSTIDLPCNEIHIHPAFSGGGGMGAGFSSFLGSFASTFALSWFMNRLTKDKKKMPEREKMDTKSYIYSQNQNLVEQGSAVPLGYGQLRIGSKVISSSINNYDFEWKTSTIYDAPVQTTFRRIAGTQNIIDPTTVVDLRDSSFDPLEAYKPSSPDKRSITIGNGGEKGISASQTNEHFNDKYDGGGGKGYGKIERLGPSMGGAITVGSKLGGAGNKHITPSFINRPFLFPPDGIDALFRPGGPSEPCVQNITNNEVLSWKSASAPMIVGNRQPRGGTSSTFQKLESIGIFRSVDVLSEGPIGGFALPITGLGSDNGSITYPFVDQDNLADYKAKLGTLKFNPANGGLQNQTAPFNSVSIESPGSGFSTAADVQITVDPPSSSESADIGDIAFNSGDIQNGVNGRPITSTSQLFTLYVESGIMTGNANLLSPPSSVPFLAPELIGDGTTQQVFDLSTIAQNQTTTPPFLGNGTFFSEGNGYVDETIQLTINADKDAADSTIESAELTDQRQIQGSFFDLNGIIDQEDATQDADAVLNYLNARFQDANPGGDASRTWSEQARIYLDDDNGTDWGGGGLAATVSIPVFTTQLRCDMPGGGFFDFNFTRTSFVVITLQQFLTLSGYTTNDVNSRACGGTVRFRGRTIQSNYTVQTDTGDQNIMNRLVQGMGSAPSNNLSLGQILRATNSVNVTVNGVFHAANTNSFARIAYDGFVAQGVIPGGFTAVRDFTVEYDSSTSATVNSRYFKFGIGCGSNTNGLTNGLQSQCLQIDAERNNLGAVLITNDGTNPKDDSPTPRGLYSHAIFPRVTIFSLRYSAMTTSAGTTGQIQIMPTNIEAVADIDNTGKISSIQILNVPDNPVFDSNDGFTPLYPQDEDFDRPEIFGNFGTATRYKDLGYFASIDRSVAPVQGLAGFLVNGDGSTLDLANTADKRALLYRFYQNWEDHIQDARLNNSDYGGAGFFNFADASIKMQNFNFNQVLDKHGSPEINNPTNPATYTISVESINLNTAPYTNRNNAAAFMANLVGNFNINTICTGRPTAVSMITAGAGYTSISSGGSSAGTIMRPTLFPQQYGVTNFRIDYTDITSNKGYKPNTKIYFYAYSNSLNTALAANNWKAHSFKGSAEINTNGSVEELTIIDPGYTFSSVIDIENDLVFEVLAGAVANGMVTADDETDEFRNPELHFPSTPMIIESFVGGGTEHVSENSITKFFIRRGGTGFTPGDFIENPYSLDTFTPPTFSVTLNANGGLATVTITSSGSGYSELDQAVELTVNFVPPTFTPQPIDADPLAPYHSIFLNNVPVRDRHDRFNFAKFDYDFRIGDMINGNNDRVNIPGIVDGAINPLLNTEYRLPVYTKMIDHPLYGPRNDGEKDYFYSYTIRNSNCTTVVLSIKIHELYYIYEGDKMVVHMNLIPLVFAIIGFTIGTILAESLINNSIPDPVTGSIVVTAFGSPCIHSLRSVDALSPMGIGWSGSGLVANTLPKAAKGIIVKAALMSALSGIVAGLIFEFVGSLIPCSLLPWLCFRIGEKIENSGEIWPAKVNFGLEYGNEGETLTSEEIVFRGIATSDYVKDIVLDEVPLPENAGTNDQKNRIIRIHRKSREMDPVSNGIKEARFKIKATLQSVTEYTEGYFNYPNTAYIGVRANSKDFPSIPKREYILKLKLIKIPTTTHYNPRTGDYSGNWDGTFDANLQWSSNPAWVIYDLLINETYGLGKYGITESDLDKWSFYEFAKRADEQVPVVINGVNTTERRYMCNVYMDRPENGYEFINKLLDNYGCSLNWVSGKIFISEDKPRTPVMMFTNTNISEDGFSYATTPKTIRYTACSVDYVDERDNYNLKSEYVEDFEGIKKYGYKKIKVEGIGVTRRGEAHRLAWNTILTRQLEKEIINFSAGIEAAYLRQGDVIKIVDNKKISHHSGGRITKVIDNRNFEIDIPTQAIGTATKITIQTPTLSDDIDDTTNSSEIDGRRSAQFTTYDISAINNFRVTVTTNLDSKIIAGYSWMVEENDGDKIKPREYKVDTVSEKNETTFEIRAIEYVEEKYNYIDASTSDADGVSLDEEREYYGHDIVV